MKCTARILKEFKSAKANSMWPKTTYGPNDVGNFPICNGNVTVRIKAAVVPEWGGSSPEIELKVGCSRCKHPYFPDRIDLEYRLNDHDGYIIGLFENQ